MVILLSAFDGGAPMFDEPALDKLRELGVTRIELLRDERTFGLVLEGWAFDPTRAADAANAALGMRDRKIQTLHQLAHVAVSAAT
jgi:hypothetical protein